MGKKKRSGAAFSTSNKKQKQEKQEDTTETDVEIDSLGFNDAMSAGLAFQQLESYDGALTAFNRAVQCDPTHLEAITHLADVYSADRQLEHALKWYKQASELSDGQQDASIWFRLGLSYVAMDQQKEAVIMYKKALEISAKAIEKDEDAEELMKAYGVTLAALAEIYAEQGDLDAVVAVFEDATKRFPKNANLHYNLANMRRSRSGSKGSDVFDKKVAKCLEKAIELSPETREFVVDLVEYLEHHQKQPEKVKELREKAKTLQVDEDEDQSDKEHKEEESSEEEADEESDDDDEDADEDE